MRKLTGGILILTSGVLLRWMQLRERRKIREILHALLTALQQMGEEVRINRTPLPALLPTLTKQKEVQAFFQSVSNALQCGDPLSHAWIQHAGALPLPAEVHTIIEDLGTALHGDETAVCQAIASAVHRLAVVQTAMEQRRPQEEQQLTAWIFSAAALLVILLI